MLLWEVEIRYLAGRLPSTVVATMLLSACIALICARPRSKHFKYTKFFDSHNSSVN